jgi:peroxiredoxin
MTSIILDFVCSPIRIIKLLKLMGFGTKKNVWQDFMGIVRSSFLIDENRDIENTWYKVSPKNTVPELMKVLD